MKQKIACFMLIAFMPATVGCSRQIAIDDTIGYITRVPLIMGAPDIADIMNTMSLAEKFRMAVYAADMEFNVDFLEPREWTEYNGWFYSDCIAIRFVHSREDYMNNRDSYPDGVFVTWPNEYRTQMRLELINNEIASLKIDLEPYALQYPLTIEDLVDNWERIDELFLDELIHISNEENVGALLKWGYNDCFTLRRAMYLLTLEDGKESDNAFTSENFRRNPRIGFEIFYYEFVKMGIRIDSGPVELLERYIEDNPDFPSTSEEEEILNELREIIRVNRR